MKSPVARASQLIACDPADAFDAFVDPGKITQFWLESASARLAPGASVRWHFMVPGAAETVTVEAFEPPSRIAFAWSDGVKVQLRFAPHPGGRTEVSAEATGFEADDGAAHIVDATEGFSIVLCDLKTFLETGRSANLVRAKAELIASKMKG